MQNSKAVWISLFLSLIINILILPISFYMGTFETTPPTVGDSAFVSRFLFIQFLPLLWLMMSVYYFLKRKKTHM